MKSTNLPKLLVFIDWFTPGFKAGGPIRSVENIVFLLKEEYQIFVITSDKDFGEKTPYSNIVPNKWLKFAKNIEVCYLSKEKQTIKSISQEIKTIAPDAIYLNSMFSLVFTVYPLVLKLFNSFSAKTVLAPRGMLKASALEFKKGKKLLFLYFFKYLGVFKKIDFHATDELEMKDIAYKLNIKPFQISKIPNPPKTNIGSFSPIAKQRGAVRLIYIARVHPIKNLLFLLKQLKQLIYSICLDIYGPIENENYWQKCLVQISNLPSNIQINYHGAIQNKDVHKKILSYHFLVLPTKGENFGHSIFESFAAGRPVLISNQTPWRDLSNKKIGWDISLSEPNEFKRAIEFAVDMDQEEYNEWAQSAWYYAKEFVEKFNLEEHYLKLFS